MQQPIVSKDISFLIDNVIFSHHIASVNGIQIHYVMLKDTKGNILLGSIGTLLVIPLQSRKRILTNMLVTILLLVECEPDLNTIGLYLMI
jgi:hypothetical protein